MNYQHILTTLYYLLIHADDTANSKEISACDQMIMAERFSKDEFYHALDQLKAKNQSTLLSACMTDMKKLQKKEQIRIIAWLCVLANADGFMERSEWQLIYQVYHKELNLPLNEIFEVQKDLTKMMWTNLSVTPSNKT